MIPAQEVTIPNLTAEMFDYWFAEDYVGKRRFIKLVPTTVRLQWLPVSGGVGSGITLPANIQFAMFTERRSKYHAIYVSRLSVSSDRSQSLFGITVEERNIGAVKIRFVKHIQRSDLNHFDAADGEADDFLTWLSTHYPEMVLRDIEVALPVRD